MRVWSEKLTESDRLRASYQEQAAHGYMTLDELGAKLGELEEIRRDAERELKAARSRQEDLSRLEEDKEVLLRHYEAVTPEALESLTCEERHKFYRMLRLKVLLYPEKPAELEFSGMPAGDFFVSEREMASKR